MLLSAEWKIERAFKDVRITFCAGWKPSITLEELGVRFIHDLREQHALHSQAILKGCCTWHTAHHEWLAGPIRGQVDLSLQE